MKHLFALLLVLAPVLASAQVPTVSETDALRLDKIMLTSEVLQLRLQQTQAEARSIVAALQKPGFTLSRTDAGAWVYQPQPQPQEQTMPTPETQLPKVPGLPPVVVPGQKPKPQPVPNKK